MSDFSDPDFEDGWTRQPPTDSTTAALSREINTLRAVCRSNKQAYAGAVTDAMAADQRAKQAEAALAEEKADNDALRKILLRGGYKPRLNQAEATLTAIHEELAAIERTHDGLDCECEVVASVSVVARIRAVLDQHGQTTA